MWDGRPRPSLEFGEFRRFRVIGRAGTPVLRLFPLGVLTKHARKRREFGGIFQTVEKTLRNA